MTNSTSKGGLTPLNWQQGNIAMSPTHFYMVYIDPKEGVTVHWNNRVTNESNKRHGFKDHDDANEWILNTHHASKEKEYESSGFMIGQRWADILSQKIVIELLDVSISKGIVYTCAYAEKNRDNNSGVIKNNIHEFNQFINTDYRPMLEGETIDDCLARYEVKK